ADFCCPLSSYTQTATPEIDTLSLHDALPIWCTGPTGPYRYYQHRLLRHQCNPARSPGSYSFLTCASDTRRKSQYSPLMALQINRSEEHTSELQSRENLVCRLLLEKKKDTTTQ